MPVSNNMLRGLREEEVVGALWMLLSSEYLRKGLSSDKKVRKNGNAPTERGDTQTA